MLVPSFVKDIISYILLLESLLLHNNWKMHQAKNIANTIFSKWGDKDEDKKSESVEI